MMTKTAIAERNLACPSRQAFPSRVWRKVCVGAVCCAVVATSVLGGARPASSRRGFGATEPQKLPQTGFIVLDGGGLAPALGGNLATASIPEPARTPPTRITSPAINLDQPVITVGWQQTYRDGKVASIWDVAQYAVGWHKNSSLPGTGGNVVLAGHNNVYGEVFRYLENLKIGDIVTVYADGRPYHYAVETRFIVQETGATPEQRRENARWIGPFPDERLTMIACWPYTGNSHRVIVIAKPARLAS